MRPSSTNGAYTSGRRDGRGTYAGQRDQVTFENFVGCSPQIKQIIRDAQTIAGLDASILITGETGTGKEVLAQSIHNFGREDKRFVAVNCAAIPDTLMESTMFGSVKGAFTGAVDSQGLLRAAEDGTLFLDEINSMSTAMPGQAAPGIAGALCSSGGKHGGVSHPMPADLRQQ